MINALENTFKEKRFILALESPGSVAPGSAMLKRDSVMEGMVEESWGREQKGEEGEEKERREKEGEREYESGSCLQRHLLMNLQLHPVF